MQRGFGYVLVREAHETALAPLFPEAEEAAVLRSNVRSVGKASTELSYRSQI